MTIERRPFCIDADLALKALDEDDKEKLERIGREWREQLYQQNAQLMEDLQQKVKRDDYFKGYSEPMMSDVYETIDQFIRNNIHDQLGSDWAYLKWRKKFMLTLVVH